MSFLMGVMCCLQGVILFLLWKMYIRGDMGDYEPVDPRDAFKYFKRKEMMDEDE